MKNVGAFSNFISNIRLYFLKDDFGEAETPFDALGSARELSIPRSNSTALAATPVATDHLGTKDLDPIVRIRSLTDESD